MHFVSIDFAATIKSSNTVQHSYKMFLKTYKHFLLIYFLFGLSPCFTIKLSTKAGSYGKLNFIPCFISLTIVAAFLFHSVSMNHEIFMLYGKINYFIAYGYMLTMIMLNLTSIYQCLRYRSEFFDLTRRIDRNEKTFSNSICSINSNKMRKEMIVKALLILLTYLVAIISLFLNEPSMESLFYKIELSILQLRSALMTLQIITYVELVRAYLKASGKFILSASLTYIKTHTEEKHINLRRLKNIYFDLWKIIQKVNYYFGWSLLALLIKCFVEVSYTFYYSFLALQMDFDATKLLRK